jgi:hypothetical protein
LKLGLKENAEVEKHIAVVFKTENNNKVAESRDGQKE